MTEYEAYDTVMSLASQTYSLMFGYFSLVFGFLVMSHMAARKLSSQLVVVVIGLYTLACLVITLNFYALNVDLDNLYLLMLEQKQSGAYDLAWFGMSGGKAHDERPGHPEPSAAHERHHCNEPDRPNRIDNG